MAAHDKLDEIAALFVLEQVPGERMPAIAQDLLDEGFGASALRLLADAPSTASAKQRGAWLAQSFQQLGIALPTLADALLYLAGHIAEDIDTAAVEPREGAQLIERMLREHRAELHSLPLPAALKAFAGASEDYALAKEFGDLTRVEAAVRRNAQVLLQKLPAADAVPLFALTSVPWWSRKAWAARRFVKALRGH